MAENEQNNHIQTGNGELIIGGGINIGGDFMVNGGGLHAVNFFNLDNNSQPVSTFMGKVSMNKLYFRQNNEDIDPELSSILTIEHGELDCLKTIIKLAQMLNEEKKKNILLQERIDAIETHIKYAPDGEGYFQAQQDFEERQHSKIT